MNIQEVRVGLREGPDQLGESLLNRLNREGFSGIAGIRTATIYRFEGITEEEADLLGKKALTDPVTQRYTVNTPFFLGEVSQIILEIGYKPGVMDPVEASLLKVAHLLGISPRAVSHSMEYVFAGNLSEDDLSKIGKSLTSQVEHVVFQKPETLVIHGNTPSVEKVPIRFLTEEELVALSNQRRLFLNSQEMMVIQNYFKKEGRDPTDVEIETLAQTWSEHNGHKTFKAELIDPLGNKKESLIGRIRSTSKKYFERVGVVTAFADNAGGIRFYEGQAIIAKGETHNSPVAVEPYGGSLTKNGGVYRDIAGCGKGGDTLFGIMMNCLAFPDTPTDQVPEGCLHPKTILLENSRGERDYGNRMGIPTIQISLLFHPDFVAKPTSMGIVVGIIPEEYVEKEEPRPNDLLITVGGRTGKDGIHGATFSSGEMTAQTAVVDATAVQIGNAIEEKRMFDALIAARDSGLIRAITDCGGGGYSSAIGEIAENVGVEVELDKVPLKYKGLAPWEIWLSESQERMIVALSPKNWEPFLKICELYEVPADIIGRFTGDHKLTIKNNGEIVAELPMEFLHHGLPQRRLEMKYKARVSSVDLPPYPDNLVSTFKQVLSHLSVCSKESMLRQYDNTVQGMSVLAPFTGVNQDMQNDGVVLAPIYGKPYGVVSAIGVNPIFNMIDPYLGSVHAVTEAISNFVAVGGNPDEAAFIDNFVWPYPDAESLGDLDRAVDGLCFMMDVLQIPCVSGKDSLSSTYRGMDGRILKIPPVLNITVFGRIPDVEKTVSADIKRAGRSLLYLVGEMDRDALGGSVYFQTRGVDNSEIPHVNTNLLPSVLRSVHQAIKSGEVLSCHDLGKGGLAVTLAEMCFGGNCGAEIDLQSLGNTRADFTLFNETAGCFVVEIESEETAERLFRNVPHTLLGRTKEEKIISIQNGKNTILKVETNELKDAWKKPLEEVIFS